MQELFKLFCMIITIARRYALYVFFLFLVSFVSFFSTFKITESPPFWYDEGYFEQIAANLSRTGDFVVQTAPGEFVKPLLISTGYPLLYPVSFVFTLFGEGVLQARLVMAFFLVALVAIFFLFSKRLFGFKVGALASILVASFPPLYGHGKSMLGEVPGLFFLLLFFFFIHAIEQSKYRKKSYYIFAGLAAGLCVATKPIFILLLPAILLAVILLRGKIIFDWKLIALGVTFFLIPIVGWFVKQVGIHVSFSEIFSYYANPYVIDNFWDLAIKNFLRFLTETSPAYFLSLFLIWVFSLIIRIYLKRTVALAELIAFFYTVFVIIAYLRVEGWYRYFFTANVVTFLFFPQALIVISQFIAKKYARIPTRILGFIPVTIAVVLLFVHVYKLQFDSFVARASNDTGTAELSNYFKNLDQNKTIFVYDVPHAVAFLPHDRYYQVIMFERKTLGTIQPVLLGIPDIVIVKAGAYREDVGTFKLYKTYGYTRELVVLEKV